MYVHKHSTAAVLDTSTSSKCQTPAVLYKDSIRLHKQTLAVLDFILHDYTDDTSTAHQRDVAAQRVIGSVTPSQCNFALFVKSEKL